MEDLLCPITHEIMRDPVVAEDGHSYERTEIERWFTAGNLTSPVTNSLLADLTLRPNFTLRNVIDAFQRLSQCNAQRDSDFDELLEIEPFWEREQRERVKAEMVAHPVEVPVFDSSAEACQAIKEVVDNARYNREDVHLLLGVIRTFPHLEHVLVQALSVLVDAELASPVNKTLMMYDHAVPLVLAVMRRFPQSMNIQQMACCFLQNLAWKSVYSRSVLFQYDATSLVVKALTFSELQTCGDLAFHALYCLRNFIIHSSKFRISMVLQDVICLVLSAMAHFNHFENVQIAGCDLLERFSNDDFTIKEVIARDGGIEQVVQAMRTFPRSELLQEKACILCQDLAKLTDNWKKLIQGGADRLVWDALSRFPTSKPIEECARLLDHRLFSDN
eukprot:GILK01014586.1.p1 GENE.GILK01014586.1~~GILK01014586.1.p1  ORF type:complete len:389 (-),score=38.63 GILK01014586.1:53-1219(-)